MSTANLKEALTSKKFLTTIVTVLGSGIASHLGVSIDQIVIIISPVMAYVVGQGIADNGKERIKNDIEQTKLKIELATAQKELAELKK